MTGEAGSAAEAVASAAASHLKTAPTTTPTTTTVAGHANGTLSAQEDVYIAGEEGPELIIGARGSEVFPTQETERILAAVNSAENATNAPDDTAPEPEMPEVEQPAMQELKEQDHLLCGLLLARTERGRCGVCWRQPRRWPELRLSLLPLLLCPVGLVLEPPRASFLKYLTAGDWGRPAPFLLLSFSFAF